MSATAIIQGVGQVAGGSITAYGMYEDVVTVVPDYNPEGFSSEAKVIDGVAAVGALLEIGGTALIRSANPYAAVGGLIAFGTGFGLTQLSKNIDFGQVAIGHKITHYGRDVSNPADDIKIDVDYQRVGGNGKGTPHIWTPPRTPCRGVSIANSGRPWATLAVRRRLTVVAGRRWGGFGVMQT